MALALCGFCLVLGCCLFAVVFVWRFDLGWLFYDG